MKQLINFILLIILTSLMCCKSDDDANPEPQMGFFPTKIILEEQGTFLEMEFTYDSKNQITLITSDVFNFSFLYNPDGLISETSYGGSIGATITSYEGDILTSLAVPSRGDVIPVNFVDGTYSIMGRDPFLKLNEQNQVLEFYGSPITYSDNPGPFAHLRFQPALFISTDLDALYCYFFSPHEITELVFPTDGNTYTVVTTTDANNNIVLAQLIDPMGDDGPAYTIDYEQRPLNN